MYRTERVGEAWTFRVTIVLGLMIHSDVLPHAGGPLRVPWGTERVKLYRGFIPSSLGRQAG